MFARQSLQVVDNHGKVFLHVDAQKKSAKENFDKKYKAQIYQGTLRGV